MGPLLEEIPHFVAVLEALPNQGPGHLDGLDKAPLVVVEFHQQQFESHPLLNIGCAGDEFRIVPNGLLGPAQPGHGRPQGPVRDILHLRRNFCFQHLAHVLSGQVIVPGPSNAVAGSVHLLAQLVIGQAPQEQAARNDLRVGRRGDRKTQSGRGLGVPLLRIGDLSLDVLQCGHGFGIVPGLGDGFVQLLLGFLVPPGRGQHIADLDPYLHPVGRRAADRLEGD